MLFFSYSRGNLLAVRSVAAELRRLGYRTWLDLESLRPGQRWREAIELALAASSAMVYCISRLSLESAWTGVELRAAQRRSLPVVPLIVDDISIEQLPPALRELHLIVTTDWTPHEMPSRAAEAIALSVGHPPAPEQWSVDSEVIALRIELCRSEAGQLMLGWRSTLSQSPLATFGADSLSEMVRAVDETRAGELHVGRGIDTELVALALGALASRLGSVPLRVYANAETAHALADLAHYVRAEIVESR